MEFIGMELIECLECSMTFPLHRPFNMCRAIRHLKAKHPHKMPEYKNNENVKIFFTNSFKKNYFFRSFKLKRLKMDVLLQFLV